MTTTTPVVLVVEDEPGLADLYSTWMRDRYTVWTALTGAEAVETVDASVDVVLLDRRLPDMTGDEVLAHIEERGLPCAVAMVSAVDADADIAELGIAEYHTKPVDGDELERTVERLYALGGLPAAVREYYALAMKRRAIEARQDASGLAEDPRYIKLRSDHAFAKIRARKALGAAVDSLDVDPEGWLVSRLERDAESNSDPGTDSDTGDIQGSGTA